MTRASFVIVAALAAGTGGELTYEQSFDEPAALGDFVLEADLRQTGRDYGHRDLCLFFGFEDPAHYFYVHLATRADEHAHNVFIVDGAPRRAIATTTTKGVDWGRDTWHRVRLERTGATIRVFFDDMTEPIMVATSDRFPEGHVGFGSFDDTGQIDNIRLTSSEATVQRNADIFTTHVSK